MIVDHDEDNNDDDNDIIAELGVAAVQPEEVQNAAGIFTIVFA